MRQQGEQEQQHEEGAGVEGVHAGDEHGQHRQRQGGGLQVADQGQAQGRRRGLSGPALDGQGRIGPASLQAAHQVRGADIAVPAHPHLAAEQERRHRLGLLPQVRGHGHVAFHVLPIAGQFQGMQNHPGMFLRQGLHLGAGLQAVGTAQRPEEIEMDPGRTFRVGRGPGVGRGGQGRAGPADEEGQQARQGAGQENSSQSRMHGRAIPRPIAESAPRIDRKRPDASLP
jgi:hypothetical protein